MKTFLAGLIGLLAFLCLPNGVPEHPGALGVQAAYAAPRLTPWSAVQRPRLGRKNDYFFGKATGRPHNIERSTSMKKQLMSIGVRDNSVGRKALNEHFKRVAKDPASIARVEGKFTIREGLFMGPRGGLKTESVWQKSKLITNVFKGGKP